MKRFLISFAALSLSLVSILAVQFVSAQTFPSTNPPNGNIVPTFNGLQVSGETTIDGFLNVGNNIRPKSGVSLGLDANVVNISKDLTVNKNGQFKENLTVEGDSTLKANLSVTGNSTLLGPLKVAGGFTVDGPIKFNDNVDINKDLNFNAQNIIAKGPLLSLAVKNNNKVAGTLELASPTTFTDTATFKKGFTSDQTIKVKSIGWSYSIAPVSGTDIAKKTKGSIVPAISTPCAPGYVITSCNAYLESKFEKDIFLGSKIASAADVGLAGSTDTFCVGYARRETSSTAKSTDTALLKVQGTCTSTSASQP